MLTTAHCVPTSAAEVLVTTGAQQALGLLVQSEVSPGQAVVTEDPTFPGFLDVVQRRAGAWSACRRATSPPSPTRWQCTVPRWST